MFGFARIRKANLKEGHVKDNMPLLLLGCHALLCQAQPLCLTPVLIKTAYGGTMPDGNHLTRSKTTLKPIGYNL
ncbi:hypothetical protein GCM10026986_08280 [Nitrincola alkalisediminis]